jgi:hypothetical protein
MSAMPLCRGYSSGRFGLERSFPENPAAIKAFLSAGISSKVIMKPARENPTEACKGCPSLLKMSAPDTTRPPRVKAGPNIEVEDGICTASRSIWKHLQKCMDRRLSRPTLYVLADVGDFESDAGTLYV